MCLVRILGNGDGSDLGWKLVFGGMYHPWDREDQQGACHKNPGIRFSEASDRKKEEERIKRKSNRFVKDK